MEYLVSSCLIGTHDSVELLAEVTGGFRNITPFQHSVPFGNGWTNRTDNPDAGRHAMSVRSRLQVAWDE